MFSKREREYLLVEMKNTPVCLRFQPSVSLLFPSQLAFIHLLHLPVSWRYLVYRPSPPMLQPWSFFPWRWGCVYLGCYIYSPSLQSYPFNCIMPNWLHISFRGGVSGLILSSGVLIPHHYISASAKKDAELCPPWRLSAISPSLPSPLMVSGLLLWPRHRFCLESKGNACSWLSVLHIVCSYVLCKLISGWRISQQNFII